MNLSKRCASFLSRTLGKFFNSVDEDSIQLGLWEGDLHLTNLELRPDALLKAHLPIVVLSGTVGDFRVKVPWKTFGSGDVILSLVDVRIVIEPINKRFYEKDIEDAILREAFDLRQKLIKRIESAEVSEGGEDQVNHSGNWFARLLNGLAGSFVSRALKNLKIQVENVEILWKVTPDIESTFSKCSIGFRLPKLTIFPQESNRINAQNLHEKKLICSGLSIFIVRGRKFSLLHPSIQQRMSNMEYVLQPLTVTGDIAIRFTPVPVNSPNANTVPWVSVAMNIDSCNLSFIPSSCEIFVQAFSAFKRARQKLQFRYARPNIGVLEDPSAWWRYAFLSVKSELRANIASVSRGRSWGSVIRCAQLRSQYMMLYKRLIIYGFDANSHPSSATKKSSKTVERSKVLTDAYIAQRFENLANIIRSYVPSSIMNLAVLLKLPESTSGMLNVSEFSRFIALEYNLSIEEIILYRKEVYLRISQYSEIGVAKKGIVGRAYGWLTGSCTEKTEEFDTDNDIVESLSGNTDEIYFDSEIGSESNWMGIDESEFEHVAAVIQETVIDEDFSPKNGDDLAAPLFQWSVTVENTSVALKDIQCNDVLFISACKLSVKSISYSDGAGDFSITANQFDVLGDQKGKFLNVPSGFSVLVSTMLSDERGRICSNSLSKDEENQSYLKVVLHFSPVELDFEPKAIEMLCNFIRPLVKNHAMNTNSFSPQVPRAYSDIRYLLDSRIRSMSSGTGDTLRCQRNSAYFDIKLDGISLLLDSLESEYTIQISTRSIMLKTDPEVESVIHFGNQYEGIIQMACSKNRHDLLETSLFQINGVSLSLLPKPSKGVQFMCSSVPITRVLQVDVESIDENHDSPNHLKGCRKYSSQNSLLYSVSEGWGGVCCVSRCIIPGYLGHPAFKIDGSFLPLGIDISIEMISTLGHIKNEYLRALSGLLSNKTSNSKPAWPIVVPRLALLSPLVKLQMGFNIPHIEFRVLEASVKENFEGLDSGYIGGKNREEMRALLEQVMRSLLEYGNAEARGYSHVKSLFIKQCEVFGFSIEKATEALEILLEGILPRCNIGPNGSTTKRQQAPSTFQSHALDIDDISAIIERAFLKMLEHSKCPLSAPFEHPALFTLRVSGLTYSDLQHTYDRRALFSLEELTLEDKTGMKLVHFLISRNKKSSEANVISLKNTLETKSTASTGIKQRGGSGFENLMQEKGIGSDFPAVRERLEAAVAMAAEKGSVSSAISVHISTQDVKYIWGQGGEDPPILTDVIIASTGILPQKHRTSLIKAMQRDIEFHFSAAVDTVSLHADPVGLKSSILGLFDYVDGINSLLKNAPAQNMSLDEVSISNNLIFPAPNCQLNLSFSAKSVEALFALHCRPLTHLSLGGVSLSASQSRIWLSSIKKNRLRYMRGSLSSLRLFDLTPDGQRHEEVLGYSDDHIDDDLSSNLLTFLLDAQNGKADYNRISVEVTGLRVCFLGRFKLELVEYFGKWGINPLVELINEFISKVTVASSEFQPENHPQTSPNNPPVFSVQIKLNSSIVLCPRNSGTSESVGLSVTLANISISQRNTTWALPTDDTPLKERNRGKFAKQKSATIPSNTDCLISLENSCSLENADTCFTESFRSIPEYSSSKVIPTADRRSSVCGYSTDHDEFFDANDGGTLWEDKLNFVHFPGSDDEIEVFNETAWATDEISSPDDLPVTRFYVSLKGTRIFSALLPMLEASFVDGIETSSEDSTDRYQKKLWRLEPNEPVFQDNPNFLTWKEITEQPFDLVIYADFCENCPPRILLALLEYEMDSVLDPPDLPEGIYLQLSMSAYCLLLSVYFDNYCELPIFFGPLSPDYLKVPPFRPPEDWPAYGSPAMINRVLNEVTIWEFALSIPIFQVTLHLDTAYFERPIDSAWMAQECNSNEERLTVPALLIRLVNTVVSISGCTSTLKLGVGIGDIVVVDIREPLRTRYPVVLHAGKVPPFSPEMVDSTLILSPVNPLIAQQGYVDAEFGYHMNWRSTSECLVLPLQVSLLITSADQWVLVNVGVNSPDVNAKDLAPIWLLVDIFSLYHRFEDYGCPFRPNVNAFDTPQPNEADLPPTVLQRDNSFSVTKKTLPRSIDVRIWVAAPHLAIIEQPLIIRSPSLVLEANDVYYRWQWIGGPQRVHMELSIMNLAIVVTSNYTGSERSRGIRGTAGSGRGVRTLLEHQSLGLWLDQWFIINRLDLHISLPLPTEYRPNSSNRNSSWTESEFGFDAPPPDLPFSELCFPEPLVLGGRDSSEIQSRGIDLSAPRAGDIVTSYEDLIFAVSSGIVFLGPQVSVENEFSQDFKPFNQLDTSTHTKGILKASNHTKSEPQTHASSVRWGDDPTLRGSFALISFSEDDSSHERLLDSERIEAIDGENGNIKSEEFNEGNDSIEGSSDRDSSNLLRNSAIFRSRLKTRKKRFPRKEREDSSMYPLSSNSTCISHPPNFPLKVSVPPPPEEESHPFTMSAVVILSGLRIVIADHVLGLHLPIVKLCISTLNIVCENGKNFNASANLTAIYDTKMPNTAPPKNVRFARGISGNKADDKSSNTADGQGVNLMVAVQVCVWAEYFNNTLKCWERLVDPWRCLALVETGGVRGSGASIWAPTPLQFNVTGALLDTLVDVQHRVGHIASLLTMDHLQSSIEAMRAASYQSPAESNRDEFDLKRREEMNCIQFEEAMKINGQKYEEPELFPVTHQYCEQRVSEANAAFTILNLTGQWIRYFQPRVNDINRRLQYLRDGDKGVLVFGATVTVIRNGRICEAPFDVQHEVISVGEPGVTLSSTSPTQSDTSRNFRGHTVAAQVSGFRWLPQVAADRLGLRALPLRPLIGLVNAKTACSDLLMQKAVSLVTDVSPINGGRQVTLRSAFTFRNCTDHPLFMFSHPKKDFMPAMNPYYDHSKGQQRPSKDPLTRYAEHKVVGPGQVLFVPILLLQHALELNNGRSLGCLWLKPAPAKEMPNKKVLENVGISAVATNLGKHFRQEQNVKLEFGYCTEPLQLHRLVENSNQDGDRSNSSSLYINCPVIRQLSESNLRPPLSYCIEVRRREIEEDLAGLPTNSEVSASHDYSKSPKFRESLTDNQGVDSGFPPLNSARRFSNLGQSVGSFDYTILVHPPLIIENLLPHTGTFELVDERKSMVWSSEMQPGASLGVHCVTMDVPLLLLLNLSFCKNTEGVQIHDGGKRFDRNTGADDSEDSCATSITLTDSIGQRILLKIENKKGGGGQRHITIYSPYWMVNTSHYRMKFRQDGHRSFPAGTVSTLGDGSKSLNPNEDYLADSPYPSKYQAGFGDYEGDQTLSGEDKERSIKPRRIFPGTPGAMRDVAIAGVGPLSPLGSSSMDQISCANIGEAFLREELSLQELTDLACMFSFNEGGGVLGFGEKRVCVQIEESEWSHPFSPDTLGIGQVLSVRHPGTDKNPFLTIVTNGNIPNRHSGSSSIFKMEACDLELGFNVSAPPGRLGSFTKVVQFWPRFLVASRIEAPLVLEQSAALRRVSKRVARVPPGTKVPFHLPQKDGERQLRLKVSGGWHRSSSFPVDGAGEYTLRLRRRKDWRVLHHVNTREAAEYTVSIPSGELEELGLWLETDWYRTQIVVKEIRKDTFIYNHSDAQPGDVLLSIDGVPTAGQDFDSVIDSVRAARSSSSPTLLRFRTMEERYRLLREHALGRKKRQLQKHRELALPEVSVFSGDSWLPDIADIKLKNDAILESLPEVEEVEGNHWNSEGLKNGHSSEDGDSSVDSGCDSSIEEKQWESNADELFVKVELRPMAASTVLMVSRLEPREAPYVIENIDLESRVYFRQRGAEGHPWNVIGPGGKASYTWEEPLLAHKLMVRVGPDRPQLGAGGVPIGPSGLLNENWITSQTVPVRLHRWGIGTVANEVKGTGTSIACMIKMDEVGSEERINVPEDKPYSEDSASQDQLNTRTMYARVVAEGPTRILMISSHRNIGSIIKNLQARRTDLVSQSESCEIVTAKFERLAKIASNMEKAALEAMTEDKNRRISMGIDRTFDSSLFVQSSQNMAGGSIPSQGLKRWGSSFSKDSFSVTARSRLFTTSSTDPKENAEKTPSTPVLMNLNSLTQYDRALRGAVSTEMEAQADRALAKGRWEGVDLTAEHQLLVEILGAKGLRATDLQGYANPYCIVYLKVPYDSHKSLKNVNASYLTPESHLHYPESSQSSPHSFRSDPENTPSAINRKRQRVRGATYYCEKTLCPTWTGQRLVFNVPSMAARSQRGYAVRVLVLSRDLLRPNEVLGQAVVPLGLLADQQEHLGWFPLNQHGARHISVGGKAKVFGSVELRLQWVYSGAALLAHRVKFLRNLDNEIQHRIQRADNLLEHLLQEQMRSSKQHKFGMKVGHKGGDTATSQVARLKKRLLFAAQALQPNNSSPIYTGLDGRHRRSTIARAAKSRMSLVDAAARRRMHALSVSLASDIIGLEVGHSGDSQGIYGIGSVSSVPSNASSTRYSPESGGMSIYRMDDLPSSAAASRVNYLSQERIAAISLSLAAGRNVTRRESYKLRQAAARVRASTSSSTAHENGSKVEDLLASYRGLALLQRPSLREMLDPCRATFLGEVDLAHKHARRAGGVLLLRPIQAFNLPMGEGARRAYVVIRTHIQQGVVRWQSQMAASALSPVWDPTEPPCKIPIEALETSGTLLIEIFAEAGVRDLHSDVCIGSLSLHLGRLADCCTYKHRTEYRRWFPITIADSTPDFLCYDKKSIDQKELSEQRNLSGIPNHKPVMQLSAEWVPEAEIEAEATRFYLCIRLGGIQASLVDSMRSQELLHLTIGDIDIAWAETIEYTRQSCVVSWLQLDNQTFEPHAPVILAPTPVVNPRPTLQVGILRNNAKSHSRLGHIEYFGLLLQELDVHLEQSIITDLFRFVIDRLVHLKRGGNAISSGHSSSVAGTNCAQQTSQLAITASETDESESYLYIESIQLHPIKLNLSFTKNAELKELFRLFSQHEAEQVIWEEEQTHSGPIGTPTVSYSLARNFPRLIGIFVINLTNDISPSPIKLNGMAISHLCKTRQQLVRTLQGHYLSALLRQLYKIVGSFDFLGDPIGALSQLGAGVRDFFYEPAEGFMQSPQAFTRGVAKGTLSLVGHTTSGVLGFTTKITRSVGGGVATLTMDQEFQRRRIERNRRRDLGGAGSRGVGQGDRWNAARLVGRAGRDMAGGIWAGATGIIVEPVKGMREQGAKGLAIGIFHGVAGFIAKPMVGCLDAVTHTGEAVRVMAGGLTVGGKPLDEVRRIRQSQVFGLDGRLMHFSGKTSHGAILLAQFPFKVPGYSRSFTTTSDFIRESQEGGIGDVANGIEEVANGIGEFAHDFKTAIISAPILSDGGRSEDENDLSNRSLMSPQTPRSDMHTDIRDERPKFPMNRRGARIKLLKKERRVISKQPKDFVISMEILRDLPVLGTSTVLVVSNMRVLCVHVSMENSSRYQFKLEWEVNFESLGAPPKLETNAGGGTTLTFLSSTTISNRRGGLLGRNLGGRRAAFSTEQTAPLVGTGGPPPARGLSRSPLQAHESQHRNPNLSLDSSPFKRVSCDFKNRFALESTYNVVMCLLLHPNLTISDPIRQRVIGSELASAGFFSFNGWEFGDEATTPPQWSWKAIDNQTNPSIFSPSKISSISPQSNLWAPLHYPLQALKRPPQTSLLAFEMDVVPWRDGPWFLGQESHLSWLMDAQIQALEAANSARQLISDSEPAKGDTDKQIELKEALRAGRISRNQFYALNQEIEMSDIDISSIGESDMNTECGNLGGFEGGIAGRRTGRSKFGPTKAQRWLALKGRLPFGTTPPQTLSKAPESEAPNRSVSDVGLPFLTEETDQDNRSFEGAKKFLSLISKPNCLELGRGFSVVPQPDYLLGGKGSIRASWPSKSPLDLPQEMSKLDYYDEIESASAHSTVLTDLSDRFEKIEGLLQQLLGEKNIGTNKISLEQKSIREIQNIADPTLLDATIRELLEVQQDVNDLNNQAAKSANQHGRLGPYIPHEKNYSSGDIVISQDLNNSQIMDDTKKNSLNKLDTIDEKGMINKLIKDFQYDDANVYLDDSGGNMDSSAQSGRSGGL